MNMGTLAVLAGAVILWFALSFVTKTWTRHLVAAVIAGITTAWWRFPTMQQVADAQGLPPMSPLRFGAIAVGGMVIVAAAGMGLRLLLGKSRR